MEYQSAYIMLTNFLQRDINILTIWKKVGFQMLFKKRGGCHFSNMLLLSCPSSPNLVICLARLLHSGEPSH